MVFKRTAIFFLSLAAAILLLHNVVPHSHEYSEGSVLDQQSHNHHHDANSHDNAHHHGSNDHGENHQDEENELADIFSVINHHPGGVIFITSHQNDILVVKKHSAFHFIIPETLYIKEFMIPPLLVHSSAEFFEWISFDPCTSTLRGPPSIAV